MLANAPEYAKAIVTFIYLVGSALALVITDTMSFGDLTTAQWLSIVIYITVGTGLVYAVPNREQ